MDKRRIMLLPPGETADKVFESARQAAVGSVKTCEDFCVITMKDNVSSVEMTVPSSRIPIMLDALQRAAVSLIMSMGKKLPSKDEDKDSDEQEMG